MADNMWRVNQVQMIKKEHQWTGMKLKKVEYINEVHHFFFFFTLTLNIMWFFTA